jgi:hypothetical protein
MALACINTGGSVTYGGKFEVVVLPAVWGTAAASKLRSSKPLSDYCLKFDLVSAAVQHVRCTLRNTSSSIINRF